MDDATSDRTAIPALASELNELILGYRRTQLFYVAAHGAFAEQPDGQFRLTPLAELLQAEAPGSLHASVLAHGDDFYRVWGELLYSIQTGQPAFDRVYGLPNWAYRQQ